MQPTEITSVYFDSSPDLNDFLVASDPMTASTRARWVERIRGGEGFVVVFRDEPPQALVLQSTLRNDLAGKPEGDELVPLQFG